MLLYELFGLAMELLSLVLAVDANIMLWVGFVFLQDFRKSAFNANS